MSEILVKVEGVSKKFCRSLKRSLWYGMQDLSNELLGRTHGSNGQLRQDEFWAVDDISFELKRGECLGLIGRNGAGKTTVLRMLNGLIKPDRGQIEIRGQVGSLIALGAGFNPVLTGRENIYVNGSILGYSKAHIDHKLDEIIDFAEIRDFIDTPVQSYSSGMTIRLGFSVAVKLIQPDVLILDEVLAVGDQGFRSKCYDSVSTMLDYAAVIFVSHQMPAVHRITNRVMLLENGVTKYLGDPASGIEQYYRQFDDVYKQVRRSHATDNAVVHGAELFDQHGKRAADFDQGSPFRLQIELSLSRKIASFELIATFLTMQRDVVAQCRSKLVNACHPNGESRQIIEMDIEALLLNPGRYWVNFVVLDEKGIGHLAWESGLISFSVRGIYSGAPIQFFPRWRILSKNEQ